MKKSALLKLKSIFGSKRGKRHREQQNSQKSSRSGSPEPTDVLSPSSDESFRPLQRTPPPSRIGPPPSPPVPTKPVAPVAPEPSGPLPLTPCPVCGRTFVPQSLAKHVKICEKMTIKKRKTFDSSRQRREGTDLEQYLPKNFGLPENSPFLEKTPPNTAKATPKPKVHSVRSAIMKPTADLQKCPHCGRAFGVRAFERHVEWCADKAKILPAAPAQPPAHIADAKQRLNARTQYKAPPVRTRRSSQTREKSSNSRSASVESSRGISPPREYGDYKHPRSRASESASSNDCHEESSPHVPVIRNSRASQNKSSGDANIKARQARLARDLSSSRVNQEPNIAPLQQCNTDPDVNKKENKPKLRLNSKKKQQLKKIEELAEKHRERSQKILAKTQKASKVWEKIECPSKSQIPVPRKEKLIKKSNVKKKSSKEADTTDKEPVNKEATKQAPDISTIKVKEKIINNRIKIKESTLSLDSLEDCPPRSGRGKNSQSVGINTELLCPCVPCVIHDTSPPNHKIKSDKSSHKSKVQVVKCEDEVFIRNEIMENSSSVELLYKNPNMVSSCDMSRELREQVDCDESTTIFNQAEVQCYHSSTDSKEVIENINHLKIANEHSDTNCELKSDVLINATPEKDNVEDTECYHNLSIEHFERNYERDLSEDSLDCDEKEDEVEDEDKNNLVSRHGSGDTYTKFVDNPADLEEFLMLTDDMILCNDKNKYELTDKDIEHLHTPKTNSIESLCVNINKNQDVLTKYNFSDTIEELKNNFQDILQAQDIPLENSEDLNRKVSDMEHITVYELKFYEQNSNTEKVNMIKDTDVKLPFIKQGNRLTRKGTRSKNKFLNLNKENRKCKMQNRTDKDYQTFIINENRDESSDEAPPLKLPRIDLKRLDEDYDPFASAARQMKELMSSETNIPKKHQNSKDSNRTLPTLKPTPNTKPSLMRHDNTKIMKDSINKTYQKTPTLHRMKSFGSTNSDNNNSNTFGGRCSSFRLNRNDKKPNLNTTFTKSSKENISSVDKPYFNRNNSLNRSFSSYNNSTYSTPKLKEKIPKLSTSMHHAFQRNTGKQSLKLDKIKKEETKKDFVSLDAILSCDNSSMTDSNYIDPILINENDNLPINVNTILNNPDIISSLESLLTTENLPAKFESFNSTNNNNNSNSTTKPVNLEYYKNENNNNFQAHNPTTPIISDLSSQYNKLMSSLEHSIASRTSGRDDDSLCEDFDLEEFMTSFDEEVNKQKSETKRSCSSTTRVVKQSELLNDVVDSKVETQNALNCSRNGLIPVNKSMSLVFSSNNIVGEKLFPSTVKRSTSLLDSIQKKPSNKMDTNIKSRHKTDQLEDDIMQSLKEFDKFYESQKYEKCKSNKDINKMYIDTVKRDSRKKCEQKNNKSDSVTNGNHTPSGKHSNDSAYSSLNRVSPSKLSLCNVKESNDMVLLEQIPAGSDSSDSHKEDRRSISSEEFLAMERSTELQESLTRSDIHSSYNNVGNPSINDKNTSSQASAHRSTSRRPSTKEALSSSGSEASLHRSRRESTPASAPRLSRFCHECGSKFPVDTAKFCIECGVKRLLV